jgi:dihydroorotate dehydrogenase electron transfer subunit
MATGASGALQVRGEVLGIKRIGSYFHLTFTAPGIAEKARPGNFVAIAVGGPQSAMLLRRSFSIYRTTPRDRYGGTVEIIFSVAGKGTAWMSSLRIHDPLDVVGPLGRPFSLPKEPVNTLLVGGGYGAAPLFTLAETLRSRGCRVDMVLGAASGDRLFGQIDGRRHSTSLTVTTDDGSVGVAGRVTEVIPGLIERHGTELIYGCGPMGMLRAIATIAEERGIVSQCAVEESMACGIGVCMTCVLRVRGNDGVVRMTRSCIEGPVFDGAAVLWDAVGTVPPDALGADAMVRH